MAKNINEQEVNFLGCIMTPGIDVTSSMESLKPEWFSQKIHQEIYRSWMERRQHEETLDVLAIHAILVDSIGDKDGLLAYLVDMVRNAFIDNATIKYNIKTIRNNGKKMDLKSKLLEALQNTETVDTYDEAIAGAIKALDETISAGSDRGIITSSEIAQIGLSFIQDRIDGKFEGLKTGIPDLDDLMFGGLRRGELITIFGPPKGGKTTAATTFLENIAQNMHDGQNPVVLVFSREMGEIQLAVRHFSSLGGASSRNLLTGNISDDDYDRIAIAVGKINNLNIVYDLDSNTPSQIVLKTAQVKRKYGRIDLVMIDHIGLVSSDKQRKSRSEEVTDITWALKTLAKKQNVPVLMVAQQNRNYSARKDKTPMLADLAESSSIEKDSDILIGVLAHREGGLRGWTELHVVGARMGEIGMAVAEFKQGRLQPGDMTEFLSAKSRSEQMDSMQNNNKYRTDID